MLSRRAVRLVTRVGQGSQESAQEAHSSDAISTRDLELSLQRLETHCPELRRTSSELDSIFLRVSNGLEKLANESVSLYTKCEAIRELHDGKESSSVLQPVVQLLNQPLNFLSTCVGEMRGLMTTLRRTDGQIGNILSTSSEVRRKMAPLTFMQVLFRVESVHLPSDLQSMFGALTEEIRRLHSRILETFNTRLEAVATSRGTVQLGVSKLGEILLENERTTEAQRLKVEQTLTALASELNENRSREDDLARLSQSISKRVGEIVVSLQSQDIISQRLAHVIESLDRISQLHSEAKQAGSPGEMGQFCLYTSKAARLQGEHLREIGAEATKSEATIQLGLGAIHQLIQEMEQCCSKPSTRSASGDTVGKAEQLQHLIELLRDPLLDTQRRTASVCELIVSLGGQASDLTGIIKELADGIWLSGLNAQVQSAKVAVGTGLEVLSAQTCSIANETRVVATDICSQVDALVAEFNSVVIKLQGLRDTSRLQHAALSNEGTRQIQELFTLSAATNAHAEAIRELATSIRSLIKVVQEEGHFASRTSTVVEQATSAIEELVRTSTRIAHRLGAQELAPSLNKLLEGKYSMASEVATHQKALGSMVNARGAGSLETPDTASVELFGDDPAPGFAGSNPPVSEPGIRAFPKDEPVGTTLLAASAANPKSQPTDHAIGSNVELF